MFKLPRLLPRLIWRGGGLHATTCHECHGLGEIGATSTGRDIPCSYCHGLGVTWTRNG